MAHKRTGGLGATVRGTLQAKTVKAVGTQVPSGKRPGKSTFGVKNTTTSMRAIMKPGKSTFDADAGTKVRPGSGSSRKTGKGAM